MRIFFDLLTAFFIVGVPILACKLRCKQQFPRWLRGLLLLLSILFSITVIYGSFFESKKLIVKEEFVQLSESPQYQIKAAILSDMHVGPYKDAKFLQQVVDQTIQSSPDIVLILGDFIYHDAEAVEHLEPLKDLTEKITTYAILGNHDYDLASTSDPADEDLGQIVKAALNKYGVIVMENESRPLNSGKLWLAGVKEIWTQDGTIEQATHNRNSNNVTTILMTHNPDLTLEIKPEHGIDLALSGHTHGGQIRLPGLGPLGRIPTKLGQAYDQGFFTVNDTPLYITSGLGESGPRARLFNPPEIVIMEIAY